MLKGIILPQFLKTRNRFTDLAVISGLFAVCLILLHLLVGRPLLITKNRLKQEFNQKQAKLSEEEELVRAVPDPQKAIEGLEKKVQEFKDQEVNKRRLPRIINMLGTSAADQKIDIISMRPRDDLRTGNESLSAGVSKVYVEMVLNCSYRAFGDYLENLSKLPVDFVVESVVIDKDSPHQVRAYQQGAAQTNESSGLVITVILSTYMVFEI